ncbi:MAG: aromatic ring-hydroxylating dioxygenase subunit alpha [Burkholderiaceae bacterium]|nr:aromatic ring-hydroxylating dioxygenase subunit alpha [Burkholderiaceae bacterium]
MPADRSTAALLDVDADVTRAHTLAKDFYLDPKLFELARERIFARSWQWIGDLADVAEPGSLAPRTLLPGHLDEPVLLARDGGGVLRCLPNVCTHRGNPLVQAPCRGATQIRCGYHSRRFDLDGRMRFTPAFEGARDFPSPADDLPRVPFASLGDLLAFASVAPAADFDEVFAPIVERLGWLPWAAFVPDAARSRDYEFDAHWALYVENYLESLHIPFVHAGLSATLDLADYRHESHPHATLQLAAARPGEAAFDDLPASSPEHGRRIAAYYWWVFPNLMLNFYPWGLSLNVVVPLAPARTRVLFRSFVRDATKLGVGAGGALDAVELEDEAVVVAVQRGLRSRFYVRGRYSPTREDGVHHFHRLIAASMASA